MKWTKKRLNVRELEKASGGDGISRSIGETPNNITSGNSSQTVAFGIIKCPQCAEEDKLEYLGHISECHHFCCETCQAEFSI